MSQELIHVYLMPGMAASPKIFEYIKLPENQFEIHLLEWLIPIDNESITDYARRLCTNIKHENVVLLGVSFGGVIVQEMSKFVSVKKLIIVSSVKSMHELPKKMLLAKATKAYALVPTQLASKLDVFEKYAFGDTITKRIELYKKYLSVNDNKYLSWAIKEMVCWNQETCHPDIIHIHGDNDSVFPIKNIKNCIVIKNGTHIAIINKYRWFNENLPKLIIGS
ncbi:alpha/beta hydrolase [Algibacter amylolyticus]|uniref:Alpha/beta hydrolase n=1 Tax=Algibacter amylolyticus TaxID=1608400 RepID=A0A5M7B233_9FLAO|nr:alpha/beta hydrolase [Algibacter amylolyticus]KAA5823509.1 alpha/beta hydrolase [Algibacter amylolyticus]MBB5267661.1 pimeloyl-ACP methyl ester carboxylesterase [Algibacter amylolyticus]TSJ73997.1 alpha/beta hydrolase [Algibacter amylolyticus]